jgi:subtilase family serine protease
MLMLRQGLSLAGLSMMAAAAFGALPSGVASAQDAWRVVTPESNVAQPGLAHTNVEILTPVGATQAITPFEPPFTGLLFGTPASVGCVYKLTMTSTPASGCDPNVVTANPTGGARAIALVDAFDDPTAAADLKAFSTQFRLAPANFAKVKVGSPGPPPPPLIGWNLEESADIEWAHAMAPNAKIFLVEATDNSDANLFKAVATANTLVAAAGGGEVSMSWGGSEFSGQTRFDKNFKQPGVVYFASTGDVPGVQYPSTSPFVVAVGGTGFSYNLSTAAPFFQEEVIWQSTGGGPSAVYPRPAYQNGVKSVVGRARGTPDVAALADPTTGVWVFCSVSTCGAGPWNIGGGTSLATPLWAGIVNSAGRFRSSSIAELSAIYPAILTPAFRDITNGFCGDFNSLLGAHGYDFCTGIGSPLGKAVK